ncbi:GntR family transcriptional regulator [Celeribacter indicus]|uniref:GntR family transcriptional regulator n=1 Tax=Celeribacter indicus TaxID=1208324 RepID=A0A0B5DW30_9RHOB|nr:GntR family transcriptional regulator [Celeribacter indicus]AJE47583.1 GntR family transcriptional regulator [Celeribacter indicus]SDW10964.1 DNA-binding transcriptional regulator, GntR family [Celeribacter indicus]
MQKTGMAADAVSAPRRRAGEEVAEGHLSDFAYNRLLDLMLAGELKPGSALQERKIAQMLEISRTPVREALFRLEAEALIVRRPERQLVVADIGLENYVRLLDLRRILEVEAAGRATGHVSAEKAAEVEQAIDALLGANHVTSAQHWAVDDLVHQSIAEAAGNPVLAQSILDLRRRTHIFNTSRISHRLEPGGTEHRALIRATAGTDAALSRRLMGEHLDNVRDAIVDYLLGIRR